MTFALFENTQSAAKLSSKIFYNAEKIISVYAISELQAALQELEQLRQDGYYLAGYIAYEALYAFHHKLPVPAIQAKVPLLQMSAFSSSRDFPSNQLTKVLEELGLAKIDSTAAIHFNYLEFAHSFTSYQQQFNQVYHHLAQGDSYQLNLTLPVQLESSSTDLLTLYYLLSRKHPVGYAAYLPFAPWSVLSISPELFFSKQGTKIRVRPMKGTIARSSDPLIDQQQREYLATDPKNRAENLIIVDLLRNDLAQFCQTGSVISEELFAIEDYSSVYQMTSSISATLKQDTPFAQILANLFPCGSISGAPKLRTLQLIEQIETEPRNIYCGTCGYITPDNDMSFNVAIRTLFAEAQTPQRLTMGVGGGITINSTALDEWNEMQHKLRFVRSYYQPDFKLVESLLYQNGQFHFLNAHLQRLNCSAQTLGFTLQVEQLAQELNSYISQSSMASSAAYKVRIELNHHGLWDFTHQYIPPLLSTKPLLTVAVAPQPIDSSHHLFRYKTTATNTRGLYTKLDAQLKPQGVDELIFINQNNILTESRFHNLIIKIAGELITTPVSEGLLPGIYREHLLTSGTLREEAITLELFHAADEIYLCNSVRGLIRCYTQ